MNSFWIFLAITIAWFGPVIFLAIRMRRAQFQYIRLYETLHPASAIPDIDHEPMFRMRRNDFRTVGRLLDIYHQEQDIPDLEAARQQVSQRRNLALSYGFGFPVALFIILLVLGQ